MKNANIYAFVLFIPKCDWTCLKIHKILRQKIGAIVCWLHQFNSNSFSSYKIYHNRSRISTRLLWTLHSLTFNISFKFLFNFEVCPVSLLQYKKPFTPLLHLTNVLTDGLQLCLQLGLSGYQHCISHIYFERMFKPTLSAIFTVISTPPVLMLL